MRIFVFGGVFVLSLAALWFMDPDGGPFAVTSGLVTGTLILLVDGAIQNRRWLRLAWYSAVHRSSYIRLSISYLFRVKVGDRYLLIKGKRFDSYIPVGGVYKYADSARQRLDQLGVLTDDLVPVDDSSKNDLRIRIPAKNLIGFFRWFESGDSRETSPWREFWEELVDSGIVSASAYPWIFERRVRRYVTPLHFSNYAQSHEIILADIYELEPTAEQAKELERLRGSHHPAIIWATTEQIRRRGATPGEKQQHVIGEPAEWAL